MIKKNLRISNRLVTKIMKLTIKLVCFVLIFCFNIIMLVSCHPTPSQLAIANKNYSKMEDIINTTPAPIVSPLQVVEKKNGSNMINNGHWKDSLENKLIKINIDADIFLPNVSAYPVLQVAPLIVDASLAKKIMSVLAKDAVKVSKGSIMTKEGYEHDIIRIQQEIAELKAGKLPPDDKRPVEEQIKEFENRLEKIQKEYSKSENEKNETNIPLNFIFEQDTFFPDRQSLIFNAEMKDGSSKLIQFNQCNENGTKYSYLSFLDKAGKKKGKAVSSDKAKETALEIINNLDIGEYDLSYEKLHENYNELIFSKSFYGIPVTLIASSNGKSSGVVTEGELSYNFVLKQESLRIDINDTGIINVIWTCPCSEIQMKNKNVIILSLDKIKEIFKQQILYNVYEDDDKNEILINNIRFGYMVIPIKNNLSNFQTIPVWDFIGPIATDGKISKEMEDTGMDATQSYLTINAIDGSIINRLKGY